MNEHRSAEEIQRDLRAIRQKIGAGVTSVSYDGRTVNYATIDDMKKAERSLVHELDAVLERARHTTILAKFGRGYG